ncbi:hypothetical protein ASE00_06150 [Sphingomonas sp. Root710]|uniref:aminotransferase class V-fold PLP-dependent enzyme n=1 Tax=Sphingomonas sp. Root710 TaxID=1736594 RepID=UPI0006FF0964|nr:aminotransferase class V-fold PLP-dependent enzyme [Sphingomonas sp. Root710]KRB86300.1 hypothetical protein ASE00_06150 [Sphingomonas sp. Root710]
MTSARDLFEVPGSGPYLLAHSVGCLPVAARRAIDDSLFAPWSTEGSDGWPLWLGAVDRFRSALATLLDTRADLICPQPGVSAALFSLLSGLPRIAGKDVLLVSRHAFPSIGFAIRQFERFGYRLKLLDGDPAAQSTWHDAIDDRVAAVIAMHVHSNSGRVSPIADIAARARKAGAISIVDVAQSAGIIPIDTQSWGVDALIGSCVKWLCGGPGAGFLWATPNLIDRATPANVGWFSHAEPFAFDIDDFRYAPDARRFWGGTPSIAPYVIATAGVEMIREIGVPSILAHNRRLIGLFSEAAGVTIDVAHRGGTLCLTTDDPEGLSYAFASADVRFDRRDHIIRLSFHIWNDDAQAAQAGMIARHFAVRLA